MSSKEKTSETGWGMDTYHNVNDLHGNDIKLCK